jgi:hypothetical protein
MDFPRFEVRAARRTREPQHLTGQKTMKVRPRVVKRSTLQMRAEKHTDRIYHVSDFQLRTEPIDNLFRPQSRCPSQRRDVQRSLSQSERGWLYAKRALPRGDDPEEVIRRIADFRSSEKSDPLYYARLTVKKAQADMGWESAEATGMRQSEPWYVTGSVELAVRPFSRPVTFCFF